MLHWLPERLDHSFHFHRMTKDGLTPFRHSHLTTYGTHFLSFTLFTANLTLPPEKVTHMYFLGILQNAILRRLVYKDWTMIVYVDASSLATFPELYEMYLNPIQQHFPEVLLIHVDWRTQLTGKVLDKIVKKYGTQHQSPLGWDLARLSAENSQETRIQFVKTLWRFFPAGQQVTFLSRDADARINLRESLAVREWMQSSQTFHRIFDNLAHANPLLAGLWGGKPRCSTTVSVFDEYGTCEQGNEPIPKAIERIESFLSDTNMIVSGYGIDELFLQTIDEGFVNHYYDNVLTFGTGSYYAGCIVKSLMAGVSRGLKLGRPMVTLVPCRTPDTFRGDQQKQDTFEAAPGVLMGTDCYFVGEDVLMTNHLSREMIHLLIHVSLHSRADTSSMPWAHLFEKYRVKLDAQEFENDLSDLNCKEFISIYHFDKRLLPCFWYCFLRGSHLNIPFFDSEGDFATNEFEMKVYEAANRDAFAKHKTLQPAILSLVKLSLYNRVAKHIQERLCASVTTKTPRIMVQNSDINPYFLDVRKYCEKHSAILNELNAEQLYKYFEAMSYAYPFSAMRDFDLPFPAN